MGNIIEAVSLTKQFGRIVAVNGVSFRIRSGECFGFLGPNGAGKTSTVRMIYGFSPLSGGELRVFGLPIESEWRRIRSRIGVCQQDNSLDPDLSVLQNLEVFAGYFNIPRREASARARELLEFIALDHRGKDRVDQLSGGMMRRLVLARALINEPELLILDEPTTGLDPQSRHQVWERLEELKAKGLTILVTTHYMDEAHRLCDRLMIMDHGKILVEGTPADLIREHAGADVAEIIDPPGEALEMARSAGLRVEDLGRRLLVYGTRGDEAFRAVRDKFCRDGCVLRSTTLEDVFLILTGRELRE